MAGAREGVHDVEGAARRGARRGVRERQRRATAATCDGTRTRWTLHAADAAALRATTWTSSPAAASPCATCQATRSTPPRGSKRSITRATRTRPWSRVYARRRRARKMMAQRGGAEARRPARAGDDGLPRSRSACSSDRPSPRRPDPLRSCGRRGVARSAMASEAAVISDQDGEGGWHARCEQGTRRCRGRQKSRERVDAPRALDEKWAPRGMPDRSCRLARRCDRCVDRSGSMDWIAGGSVPECRAPP